MKYVLIFLSLLVVSCDSTSQDAVDSGASQLTMSDATSTVADTGGQAVPGAKLGVNSGVKSNGIPLGQLPQLATPRAYTLEFTIDPAQAKFSGRTQIHIDLNQDSDSLYLHGKDLNVVKAQVVLKDGHRLDVKYEQVHADGIAMVRFPRVIAKGPVTLELSYDAFLGTLLHGLYKVVEGNNAYVFTQMESVFARQAFPCFDEPRFKTPFDLSVVVPQDDRAVANTPMVSEKILEDGRKKIIFATSQPMTTYLLALAIGPLDIVDAPMIPPNSVRRTPLPLRGVAVAGKGKQLEYALAETGAILASLEQYFDMAYPYAKLDIIAVPDFEAGAMENIGAITFRESLLLLQDNPPPQQKRAFTSVMAHELAHMWFGDLVTMPWWDDIWLNESFATWMSYKAVADYDPEQRPEIAQLKRSESAMKVDALTSARQIREPVLDNDGIAEAFDGITYAKGGAILDMFERYVGEEKFRDGVRRHMIKFAHGNADINDLVKSLSASAGQDLGPAVNTFLFQNGIPLLNVLPNCRAKAVTLSQSRFLPLGSTGDAKRQWKIPVCLKYSVNNKPVEQCVLLEEQQQTFELNEKCDGWLLPNANYTGYYHWVLPQAFYARLDDSGDLLNQREWMSIADSAKSAFASGQLSVSEVWPVIEQLSQSKFPNVARSMIPTLRYMDEFLADDPKVRSMIRSRGVKLYSEHKAYRAFDESFVKSLGSNEESLHLSNIAGFMAEVLMDVETRKYALEKARGYIQHGIEKANISKASLDTILTVGVQDGGEVFYDQLLERVKSSQDAWFRDTALSALARTKEIKLGERVRALALSDELRSNEVARVLASHVEERVNTWPTWRWMKANYDALAARMPKQHLSRIVGITAGMCDANYANEVEAFFRPRFSALPGGTRRLDTALESMKICSISVAQQREQAQRFFSASPRR